MRYDPAKELKPFKYLSPEKETPPLNGFYGITGHVVDIMVNIGQDSGEFVFTVPEMNAMDRGTLTFRAKDSGGAIGIKKCSVSGLKMVITLERRVVNFGIIQAEWITKSLYSY